MAAQVGRLPIPIPISVPLLVALAVVGLAVGGLLVGYEPIGGDPDGLYRPIKTELARALREGRLPLWSDRFGLGAPLAAESHIAAFYPPNWLLYRTLDVSTAYRVAMWLHYLALVAATFGYGRALGLTPQGSALAALALGLSGFQASHACHEPFYQALVYLPLALMLAERFLAAGGLGWLALLALALGAQWTLGHFQLQAWTSGLVLLTGLTRWRAGRCAGRRALALSLAVGWGLAVAAVQLGLTGELIRATGFARPAFYLTNYAFPPDAWAQLALPHLFMGFAEGSASAYWDAQGTSADEACLYIGTVPLILAGAGLLARGGPDDRRLDLWRWLAPLGLILATMPRWWPEGFLLLVKLPVLGHFRAPGRYTLLTMLGLALLAGRGLDRALAGRWFWGGVGLAGLFGLGAAAWGVAWSEGPAVRLALGPGRAQVLLAEAALVWAVSLAAVALGRRSVRLAYLPLLVAGGELSYLYYQGTTPWGRPIPFPGQSPVFRRLAAERGVGLVDGDLQDIAVRAGLTVAYPNLAIMPPPPVYLLEESKYPRMITDFSIRLMKRYGVTHGVYEGPVPFSAAEGLYLGGDPVLDAILPRSRGTPLPRRWRLERYPDAFPEARCARKVQVRPAWPTLFLGISGTANPDEVWFLAEDAPPEPPGPRARSARVVRWSGASGLVEHDGTCDLVLRRTYAPGWSARVNEGPWTPVARADGGLQAIRLAGSGPSRVAVRYWPAALGPGLAVSLTALAALGLTPIVAALRRSRQPPEARRPP